MRSTPSLILQSHSPQQTFDYGSKLAPILEAGDLISLTGELGAGKTVFTKGLAKGLGITEIITSPTFTIISEYEGRLPFYHFDLYRLNPDELDDLGYEDYFYGEGTTVVEWGDKIKEKLPPDYLSIDFTYGKEEFERILKFAGHGNWQSRMEKIKESLSK